MDTEVLEDAQEVENIQTTDEVVEPGKVEEPQDKPETEPAVDLGSLQKQVEAMEKQLRTHQSEKDKAVRTNELTAKELNETKRRLKAAEATVKGLREKYADDPDFDSAYQDSHLRSKLQTYEESEKEQAEAARKQQADIQFIQDMVFEIKEDYGLDATGKDKAMFDEVAKATPWNGDYRILKKAFLSKAREVSKGGKQVTSNPEFDALVNELANIKKQLGIAGVDGIPTEGRGAVSSDEQFLQDYSAGKSNDHERAKKLLRM